MTNSMKSLCLAPSVGEDPSIRGPRLKERTLES
jgi:hypothetical protein